MAPPPPPAVPSSLPPPSTPNPSRFRLPRRPDRAALSTPGQGAGTEGGGGGVGSARGTTATAAAAAATTTSSSQARPTPRFVPSWKQTHVTPGSGSGSATRAPARPLSQFSQFTQFSQLSAPRRGTRHSRRDDDQDAIDEGSSPPVIPESPPVLTPAPYAQPVVSASKTLWRPKRAARPQEDIEDAEDSEDLDAVDGDGDGDGSTASGETVEMVAHPRVEAQGHEMILGEDDDDGAEPGGHGRSVDDDDGTPVRIPSIQSSKLPLSTRPFKRRKLFVSPGLITSSPPEGLSGERSTSATGRRRRRRQLDGDDDVDDVDSFDSEDDENDDEDGDDSDDDDDGHGGVHHHQRLDDDDMRDIIEYGEMLEYGDGAPRPPGDDGDQDQHGHDPDFDADEEADYRLIDHAPTRGRTSWAAATPSGAHAPVPRGQNLQPRRLFAGARLFAPASSVLRHRERRDADNDAEAAQRPLGEEADDHRHPENATTGPFSSSPWQQPPADFFSPQKQQKRRGLNKKSGSGGGGEQQQPHQYVPGGLAAELRDWLVQIKSGGGGSGGGSGGGAWATTTASGGGGNRGSAAASGLRSSAANPMAIRVEESACSSPSSGMRLVLGQPPNAPDPDETADADSHMADPPMRLLLAGQGRPLGPTALDAQTSDVLEPTRGSTVHIAPPVWGIVLDGQRWTVASDWRV